MVKVQQDCPGLCAYCCASIIWRQLAAQDAHQRHQWLCIFGVCRCEGLRRW